jgi:phosphate transport system protein
MRQDTYARQIENLREDLLRLGSMVEHALSNALRSLEQWDTVTASQVITDDTQIDVAQRVTEEQVIKLIAAQSFTDNDPRLLVTAFAIAGELERIGDYACSIARRVNAITRQPAMVLAPSALVEVATLTRKMLNTSLEAFLRQDTDLAYKLKADEERVDELEKRLRAELLDLARAEPQRLDSVIGMLDIVHALERVADRTTNIGERVIYLATSVTEELNP